MDKLNDDELVISTTTVYLATGAAPYVGDKATLEVALELLLGGQLVCVVG